MNYCKFNFHDLILKLGSWGNGFIFKSVVANTLIVIA